VLGVTVVWYLGLQFGLCANIDEKVSVVSRYWGVAPVIEITKISTVWIISINETTR